MLPSRDATRALTAQLTHASLTTICETMVAIDVANVELLPVKLHCPGWLHL